MEIKIFIVVVFIEESVVVKEIYSVLLIFLDLNIESENCIDFKG